MVEFRRASGRCALILAGGNPLVECRENRPALICYRVGHSKEGAVFRVWSNKLHYYPHHIGDFIRDTSRLSDSQCMAYLRLLWSYYDTETPLPNSPEKLAFQIGASASDVALILDHFFVLDGDVYRHHRVEKEIAHYRTKAEKASASANARWKKAKAMRTHSDCNASDSISDANQEPRTKNQEPSLNKYSADKPQAPAKADRSSVDKPEGVQDQTWADFKKLRAAKRAPLTQTAMAKIAKQASLAGYTLEQALQTCCERGWQGFDASWVIGKPMTGRGPKPEDFSNKDYGEGIQLL